MTTSSQRADGANLPSMGVKYALGEPVPDPEVAWGTEMRRHWDELFVAPDGDRYRYHPDGLGPSRARDER